VTADQRDKKGERGGGGKKKRKWGKAKTRSLCPVSSSFLLLASRRPARSSRSGEEGGESLWSKLRTIKEKKRKRKKNERRGKRRGRGWLILCPLLSHVSGISGRSAGGEHAVTDRGGGKKKRGEGKKVEGVCIHFAVHYMSSFETLPSLWASAGGKKD